MEEDIVTELGPVNNTDTFKESQTPEIREEDNEENSYSITPLSTDAPSFSENILNIKIEEEVFNPLINALNTAKVQEPLADVNGIVAEEKKDIPRPGALTFKSKDENFSIQNLPNQLSSNDIAGVGSVAKFNAEDIPSSNNLVNEIESSFEPLGELSLQNTDNPDDTLPNVASNNVSNDFGSAPLAVTEVDVSYQLTPPNPDEGDAVGEIAGIVTSSTIDTGDVPAPLTSPSFEAVEGGKWETRMAKIDAKWEEYRNSDTAFTGGGWKDFNTEVGKAFDIAGEALDVAKEATKKALEESEASKWTRWGMEQLGMGSIFSNATNDAINILDDLSHMGDWSSLGDLNGYYIPENLWGNTEVGTFTPETIADINVPESFDNAMYGDPRYQGSTEGNAEENAPSETTPTETTPEPSEVTTDTSVEENEIETAESSVEEEVVEEETPEAEEFASPTLSETTPFTLSPLPDVTEIEEGDVNGIEGVDSRRRSIDYFRAIPSNIENNILNVDLELFLSTAMILFVKKNKEDDSYRFLTDESGLSTYHIYLENFKLGATTNTVKSLNSYNGVQLATRLKVPTDYPSLQFDVNIDDDIFLYDFFTKLNGQYANYNASETFGGEDNRIDLLILIPDGFQEDGNIKVNLLCAEYIKFLGLGKGLTFNHSTESSVKISETCTCRKTRMYTNCILKKLA